MGISDAFLKVDRKENVEVDELSRIKNFNEFHTPLKSEERKKQAARCMNCGVPYCGFGNSIEGMTVGCPLHNMCPEFNDALCKGQYKLALERLLKTNPFPEFTSRVCPALCEKACVSGLNFEPVTTRDNEYEIIEYGFENGLIKERTDISRNGKKVAVVGSGPAGLACAYKLNSLGYEVTVFEKNDDFGGLLMYGIPNMKLEKKIIKRRIDLLKAEGVNFVANYNVDSKEKGKDLLKNYDAVCLACGSEVPRKLNVENENANNIYFAVDFLTRTTKALKANKDFEVNAKNKNVLVVGGGDTGNDCVGTCVRMGCKSVVQLEMMDEPPLERGANNPWPCWPLVKKTDYGQKEAIAVFGKDPRVYNTTVNRIITDDKNNLKEVEIVKIYKKVKDGKVVFEKDESTIKKVPCDLLLIAAGFVGFNAEIKKAFNLEENRGRVLALDYQIKDKLFTCGDMLSGQSLVVKAISSGLQCAEKINNFLDFE
ncbi:MAG: glutamate synthase subunit beta [Erysipelotrichaceae bacterium]|nr:glutamate synthase subunit beta [Erysipelotrichaceae bacterium]